MMNVVELTQKLISFQSVTPDNSGALVFLKQTLEGLGFSCEVLTFEQENTSPVSNLFAKITRSSFDHASKHFCFAGHSDVVPAGNEEKWDHHPFSGAIDNAILYGRGACDMKGAIAAFICATSRILEDKNFSGTLSFLITGDEEGVAINGTKKVLDILKNRGEKIDFCLVGEPTSNHFVGDTIKIGRRGSLSAKIATLGIQGHVAYPDLAQNPTPRMLAFLHEVSSLNFEEIHPDFSKSNLEITTIDVGNNVSNVIPEKITAAFNIRFNPCYTIASLKDIINNIAQKHLLPNDTISFQETGNAFINEHQSLQVLVRNAVKVVTNQEPELSTSGGTSDARFITHFCPTMELGLINKTIHQINECVSIDDLKTLENIYFSIVKNFFSL